MIPVDRHTRGHEHALRLIKLEAAGARQPGLDPFVEPAGEQPRPHHLRLVRPEDNLHPTLGQRDPAFIRRI